MQREMTAKNVVRYGGMILFFIILVSYGVWRSRDLLFGIRMSVAGITDGMTAHDPILTFSGDARHANSVTVDGRTVPLAQDGSWQDTIALQAGVNIVTVTAKDKFNRTIKKEYSVYYQN